MSKAAIEDANIKSAVDQLESAILRIPGRKAISIVTSYNEKAISFDIEITAAGVNIGCKKRNIPPAGLRLGIEQAIRQDGIVTVKQYLGLKSQAESGEWVEHKNVYGFGCKFQGWIPLPIEYLKATIGPLLHEQNAFYCFA